jgi:hypothetical protein
MSQRRVVVNGEYRWLDEGPSAVNWSGPIRGSLTEGGPGAYDRQRQAEYQRKHLAKKRAEE